MPRGESGASCAGAHASLRLRVQRIQSRVGTEVCAFLLVDPGVQGFASVHDAPTGAHAKTGRPLPSMAPDIECL